MNTQIIADFVCYGEYMVVVKLDHGTHVMSYDEWKNVYGKLYPERWKEGKRAKNRKLA